MLTHSIALIIKNFYLWKRELRGTLCEILVPMIFIFLLYIFKSQASSEDIPQQSYITDAITLTSQWDASLIQNGIYSTIKDCSSPKIGGKIGIAPKIPITQKLQAILESYPSIEVEFFKDKDAFIDHITSKGYPQQNQPQICFGILFDTWQNGVYNYTLSYNLTESNDIPRTVRTDYIHFEQNDLFQKYINSGFTRIVNWIDNIILQTESGNPNLEIKPKLTIMETESFTKTNILDYVGNFMNIFIVIPMIVPYLRLSSRILHEKEKRIREGMMMMGLGKIAFYFSWIFSYLAVFALISLLVAIALKINFFTAIDFSVIYLIHFLFSCALLAQSLFITVFFDKQRTGIIGATFLFLFQFMYSFNNQNDEDITNADNQAASGTIHGAITLASKVLLIYQSRDEQVTMDMLSQLCNRSRLIYSINSCYINFIVFFVLFMYLDQVISNEFGQRKHWLFFIGCSLSQQKKKPTSVEINEQSSQNNYIEEVEMSLKRQENENKTIKIDGLVKQFQTEGKTKTAVNQLNLQMYSGQVFSFLGHNGAGKSTTISMLTGMIPPTQGTAYIKGYDIRKDIDKIRSILGVCPQHDILFDQLTVREHLYLFGILKGMSFSGISVAVNRMIKDVDLTEKANALSSSLSGGQKRKLSVAIAFIGESEVILLDEPTSGMDVQARRHVWDMVKNYKQSKIIILTTHFMDEADYLGDRIGIISDGGLKCVGSNVFLKERYGNGYNFTFVKEMNNSPSEPIIQFIKKYAPDSNLISDFSAEVAFQVPYKYIPSFQALFNELESKKSQLKIRSYGISITTLEEVFLKVASMNDNHIVQPKKMGSMSSHQQQVYNDQQYVNVDNSKDDKELQVMQRIRDTNTLFFIHVWALIKKRLHYFRRDKKGLCCEIILPIFLVAFGLMTAYFTAFDDYNSYQLNPDIFFEEDPKIFYGSSQPLSSYQQIIQDLKQFDATSYTLIDQVSSIDDFNSKLFNKKTTEVKFGYYLENMNPNTFEYTAFINTVSLDGIPMSVHLMNNAIINQVTNKNIQINITNQPLKLTQNTKNFVGVFQGVNAVLFFSMGISFIPASIISYIVRERQEQVKHQQVVSGVSLKAYWISNFIIDYIKYLIPCIASPFLAYAFKIDSITQDGNFLYVIILFIFYGLSLLPLVYLFSFLHKDYGNAQIIQFFFHFMFGGIGAVIFAILRFFESTRSAALKLQWVMRLNPSFSVYYGFTNLTGRKYQQLADNLDQLPNQMDLDVMGGDLMYLILSFFVFTGILIFVEIYRNRKSIFSHNLEDKYPYHKPSNIDTDVDQEMQELQKSNPEDYTVLVRNLRKVFPPSGGSSKEKPKVAVNNLNFGVRTGDVFCFLGVNGAGKTTTMRMLTGDEPIGSGEAYIQGYKIPDQISDAQQFIGYCPQFDALLDNLTAREHLELYARIKGIPKDLIEGVVCEKLDELNLRKFENVVARTYSGGNKRKLSVAIAMLGNPPIAFLDEPSTGMDPGNRRFMWNVISDIATNKKKTSIILTTHSMEEAEALGTKVGIVVGGNFQCMGSIQHLKSKFGKGYEVSVKTMIPSMQEISGLSCGMNLATKVNAYNIQTILSSIGQAQFIQEIAENRYASSIYNQIHQKKQNEIELSLLLESICNFKAQEEIKQFFQQHFDNHEVLEYLNNYLKIRVQSNQTLGYLFGVMSQSQQNLRICSYTICQTSLEQIFHDIANSANSSLPNTSSPSFNSENAKKINNPHDLTITSLTKKQFQIQEQEQEMKEIQINKFQELDIKHIQIKPGQFKKRSQI